MFNVYLSFCLSKTSQWLKTPVPVQTLEGGVDFMESQYTAIPWLSKSIAVFQYIQVIIRLKLQDNISIPY